MLLTSGDILNWAIAISVLAVAFFICWALYLLINTISKGAKIIKRAENLLFKAENLLDSVKNKVKSSASYLYLLTEMIKRFSSIIKDKKSHKEDDDEESQEYDYEVKPKKRGKKKKLKVK